MTIESNISKNTFAGNGQTTIFPFTYKIWKTDEIKVTIEDEKGITSSITPFAVTINKNGGGDVVLYLDDENKTPIPTGYTIALTRNMPFLQEQDYLNGGRFNAEVIEDNFDIACAERQQLKEAVERTIQIPPTSGIKPEKLLNEIFNAKNTAVEQAGVATAKAQISTEQAALSGSYAQSASEQAVLSQEYASTAKAWAESDTPPDPTDENSKSARTWAMIASDVVPIATNTLPGKVSPQYPLKTDDIGRLTYDGYNRGWGAKSNDQAGAVLNGSVDLNDVLDNGFYSVNSTNLTTLNRPSKNPGLLNVYGWLSETISRKVQVFYDLFSSSIYVRSFINSNGQQSSWSNWSSINGVKYIYGANVDANGIKNMTIPNVIPYKPIFVYYLLKNDTMGGSGIKTYVGDRFEFYVYYSDNGGYTIGNTLSSIGTKLGGNVGVIIPNTDTLIIAELQCYRQMKYIQGSIDQTYYIHSTVLFYQ